MIREIGSEFWLSCDSVARQDSSNTRFLLSGRTALDYIIRDIKAEQKLESVYMPSYCCKSMLEPFVRNGVKIDFYKVSINTDGFHYVYDSTNRFDAILFLDYFGYENCAMTFITEQEKHAGKVVIYDATHKLNGNASVAPSLDYSFCSYRKWFYSNAAVVCKYGQFAAEKPMTGRNLRYEGIRDKAARLKQDFIARVAGDKGEYLKLFKEAEEILGRDYIGYAAEAVSIDRLACVDIDEIAKQRRANAQRLINGLKELDNSWLTMPIQKVKDSDCPMFVPVLIDPDIRDNVRRRLIEQRIYCPVHWPLSSSHEFDESWKTVYNEELSLICDQRYGYSDMDRILETLKSIGGTI